MISKKLFRAMIFKTSQVLCFTVSFSESYDLLLLIPTITLLFSHQIYFTLQTVRSFFSHGSLLFHDLHARTKTKICGLYERKHCTCLSEAGLLLTVISRLIMVIRCNREGHWRWQGQTRWCKMALNKENKAAIGETWLCTWQNSVH